MRAFPVVVSLGVALLAAERASATPSTTVWAPSTTAVQGYLVPHLTYDTYFWKGPYAGQAGSPVYPVTTGVTMGVLPFEKVNLEVGFDLMLPSQDPLYLNAKLGVPEGALFSGAPGLAVGVYGVGTRRSSATVAGTDYDILYGQVQKTMPWGGYASAGGYWAAGSKVLWTEDGTPAGKLQRAGFIGAVTSPDIPVGASWLQKVVLAADVQTGKNVFGASGASASFYFNDTVSMLTGPVWFFDSALQPGSRRLMWTVQLDVDLPLRAAAKAAPPSGAPAVTPAAGTQSPPSASQADPPASRPAAAAPADPPAAGSGKG